MTPRTRRRDALSRERIVGTAVEVLDASGENGLTFRALTERLATGPGAIYWHVANKDELLAAATDDVVAGALAVDPGRDVTPRDGVRAVALGLFDAIDDHPWLGAQLSSQLSRAPWGPVTTRILESVGQRVRALEVPEDAWFTATTALVHHILGAAAQNAANARVAGPDADRSAMLGVAARAWEELDPVEYPFVRAVADRMREHDDREQFLAGIDLVLAGIAALPPGSSP